MRSFVRLVLVFGLSLGVSGCLWLLRKPINERWPELTTLEQRTASTQANIAAVTAMEEVDALVQISAADFSALVEAAASKALTRAELTTEQIDAIEISDLKVGLGRQFASVESQFAFNVRKAKVKVSGAMEGIVAVSVDRDGLVLNPAFSTLKLTGAKAEKVRLRFRDLRDKEKVKAKLRSWFANDATVLLVNAALEEFIGNVNRIAFDDPIRVPVAFWHEQAVPAATLARVQSDAVTFRIDDDLRLGLGIETAALRMTPQALQLIARLTDTPPAEPAPGPEALNVALPEGYSEADFRRDFDRLGRLFEARIAESMTVPEKGATTAMLSKRRVAQLLSGALPPSSACLTYENAAAYSGTFHKPIRPFPIDKLSCSGLYRDFNGENCDRSCSYGGCDFDCKWYQADCHAKKAACKVDREIRRSNCHRKVAECKVAREARRVAHQVENEARVAKCKAERELLHLVDNLVEVGIVDATLNAGGTAAACFRSIEISPDLERVTVRAALKADARVHGPFRFNPEGIGHLACVFPYASGLDANATLDEPNYPVPARIEAETNAGRLQALKLVAGPFPLSVKIRPTPYEQLVSDPKFVLNCAFAAVALPAVGLYEIVDQGDITESIRTAMLGRYEDEIDPVELRFQVPAIRISAGDRTIELSPYWGEKAFRYQADDVVASNRPLLPAGPN